MYGIILSGNMGVCFMSRYKDAYKTKTRISWFMNVMSGCCFLGGGFKYSFMFIPIWGNDPILTNMLRRG